MSNYKDQSQFPRYFRNQFLQAAGLTLIGLLMLTEARAGIEYQPQTSHSDLYTREMVVTSPSTTIEQLQQNQQAFIPKIYWPARQHWVDLYNGTWEILLNNLRSSTLVTDGDGETRHALPAAYIDEGYSNASIFQWDSIFAVHTARFINRHFYLSGSLDNFYTAQHATGFICREISETNGDDVFFKEDPDYPWFFSVIDRKFNWLFLWISKQDLMKELYDDYIQNNHHPIEDSNNPPLFAWAELELSRYQSNPARLVKVADVIERHLQWLESHKSRTITIHRHAYKGEGVHLFHQTPLGSGMDNIPLYGDGWVDMSAQMYLAYDQLSQIYLSLGKEHGLSNHKVHYQGKARFYRNKADKLKAAINECLWSEADGFYFNVNGNCRNKVRHFTLASIWPMFAGVASENQAEKLVEKLFDPEQFYSDVPFPVVSRKEKKYFFESGGYWQGGVWAPTNYMVIRGLMNYGYIQKAREATTRYLDALASSFEKTGTLHEYYNVQGQPGYNPMNRSANTGDHYARGNFVGWTGLAPISLMIELMLGIRFAPPADSASHTDDSDIPKKPDRDTIYWDLSGNDEVGIENLNINGKRLSLHKQRRHHENATAHVRISAKGHSPYAPEKLVIIHNKNRITLPLQSDIFYKWIEVPAY